MSPSFWRVAAGACMIAAGLFAGSSAIAQAAPDSSADGGSSRSHSPNADSHSSNVDRKPGQVGGNSSKAGSTSANRGRSGFGPAANSGPKARQPYANSAKVPTANAVASVPVASVPEAIQQAASSAASTIRQISQAAASSSASPAPIAVTPNTAPSKALEPLTSMVESVANVVIGPKAAHALVDVANQFIDGVLTPTPTVGINPVGAINNGGGAGASDFAHRAWIGTADLVPARVDASRTAADGDRRRGASSGRCDWCDHPPVVVQPTAGQRIDAVCDYANGNIAQPELVVRNSIANLPWRARSAT